MCQDSFTFRKGDTIIYQDNNWLVTANPGQQSGFISGMYMGRYSVGDSWIRYNDNSVGYNFPERLPKKIKRAILDFIDNKNWFIPYEGDNYNG